MVSHRPLLLAAALVVSASAQGPASYERFEILTASSPATSRSTEWTPGAGIPLEVSGMAWYRDRLAVCIRKGEVWLLGNTGGKDPGKVTYQLFASGLHEPLGLLADGEDLLVGQRAEVTRLADRDGDLVADSYLTECDGWNVSGNYHAYTYGPDVDAQGQRWVTLNLGMGKFAANNTGWRGWGGTIGPDGRFQPQCFGMRSPCGLGPNGEGDLFFSDQQGTWIPATPIYHLRPGVFYGNQESLGTLKQEGAPFQLSSIPKANQPYPQALESCPEFVPPAVWLPYNKMGRSATDIELIKTGGKFGPFEGQLLVGEFTNSAINRVFLEKVNGEYQGACFPFLDGFPSAVLRLRFAEDGALFVGLSNRGWSSLGNRSYGLMRIDFTGAAPFAIHEMRATPTGFKVSFTQSVDPASVLEDAFTMERFTYQYSSKYGGDEILKKSLPVTALTWSEDHTSVHLTVPDRARYYVHELRIGGVTDKGGQPLEHPRAYYTLNQIPGE